MRHKLATAVTTSCSIEVAMPPAQSVAGDPRYVITEQGRYDLIMSRTCQCDPRLKGLLVQCAECGTVYGHLAELDKAGRRARSWNLR